MTRYSRNNKLTLRELNKLSRVCMSCGEYLQIGKKGVFCSDCAELIKHKRDVDNHQKRVVK